MRNIPIWKPLLILGLLGLCAWRIYPPSRQLKPGLDLQGGTTLVYQVNVPPGQDDRTVLDQTIETLQKRVDPNGVMNLIWRRQAGNRIEIQMPPPAPYTQKLREKYIELRDHLLTGNIAKRQLDSLVSVDLARREVELDRLVANDTNRRQLLSKLIGAYDDFVVAQRPYEQVQDELRAAQSALNAAPPATLDSSTPDVPNTPKTSDGSEKNDASDSMAASHEELRQRIEDLDRELIAKTRAFVEARRRYETARDAVLATNINPHEFEAILNLPTSASPTRPTSPDDQEGSAKPSNPRLHELEHFIANHPDRAEAIRETVEAYDQYSKVKSGPLDDPNDLIALLKGSGVLEFRIAAPHTLTDVDEYHDQLRTRGPKAGPTKPFRWFVVDDITSFADDPPSLKAAQANPKEFFESRGMMGASHGQDYYLLLAATPDASMTQSQPGWELSRATRQADDRGFPAVGFSLNRIGGQLMGQLTGNPPRQSHGDRT